MIFNYITWKFVEGMNEEETVVKYNSCSHCII